MSEDAKAAPVKKKGRMKLVILIVVILLLVGGGGAGAFWWMSRGSGEEAKAGGHAAETHDDSHAAAVPLPTFTVNLADKDASRYLRTTLALLVPDAEAAAELTSKAHGGESVKVMKARSAILELLATQTADQLATAEGKEALKKSIAAHASKSFGTKVSDVLFSEFVVQF